VTGRSLQFSVHVARCQCCITFYTEQSTVLIQKLAGSHLIKSSEPVKSGALPHGLQASVSSQLSKPDESVHSITPNLHLHYIMSSRMLRSYASFIPTCFKTKFFKEYFISLRCPKYLSHLTLLEFSLIEHVYCERTILWKSSICILRFLQHFITTVHLSSFIRFKKYISFMTPCNHVLCVRKCPIEI